MLYSSTDGTEESRTYCWIPNEKHPNISWGVSFGIRQCPTLPGRLQPSTIGAERLNFCVRYGNRWDPFAITTGISRVLRTMKTAHPDFFYISRKTNLNFPFGLTQIFYDQVLDRLVSASFYVTAFTPLTYHLVVFQGSYFFRMGYLFLRWASRLDAFSVYPVRISLPSCALGRTTVAPVMRSLRSSRTRSNSSHVSFAHDG